MQHVRDHLWQLATVDPGDAFVLSVYLDMRPHVQARTRRYARA